MVPPPSSAPPIARVRPHRRSDRARGCLRISLALLTVAAGPTGAADLHWKSASLVALEGRRIVHDHDATVPAGSPLELYLVVEGEREGLPVYCTACPMLRVAGRAVPERMIVRPDAVGLEGAEIRWQSLSPSQDARTWTRSRLDASNDRWSMDVLDLPGDAPAGQERFGTVRFAVAIVPPGGRAPGFRSSGWDVKGRIHPDEAPGFRVTRFGSESLAGRAQEFVRLPVLPDLPASFARNKIALSPIDLVVGGFEELGKVSLEPLRSAPLDGKEWSWMLEPVEQGIRRRASGGALVGPRGRGVRWGPGVQQGDVLLVGGVPAILRSDDGDGWLSERDRALGVVRGRVREGTLSDFPGVVHVLRPRLFITLRERLTAAGYGELGQSSSYTADLAQACREFQRDHELPETGFPDAETEAMLDGVLAAMDGAAASTPSSDR